MSCFRDKTDKDWDATFSLVYAGKLGKQILVHARLQSLVQRRDTWHAPLMEIDALDLSS